MNIKKKLYTILILISLSIVIFGCGSTPESVAQAEATPTPTPTGIQQEPTLSAIQEVVIHENEVVLVEIVQEKTFNQCASAAPFRAEIEFSQTTGQTTQRELVLTAAVGGEAGLSAVAKLNVAAEIEAHFARAEFQGAEGFQKALIEVPAHAQQKYILVWQEDIREGTVEYLENGERKIINYSYHLGMGILSSTVIDLPCPTPVIANTAPDSPTAVPAPTATPVPPPATATPRPPATNTPAPTNTPPDSILAVGERWYADGRLLVLDNYEFEDTRLRFDIRFINNTGATSTFNITLEDFTITDNLGRRSTSSYPLWCGTGGATQLTLVLDGGESQNCEVHFNSGTDYANAQVNQLIFSVTASVFQPARWQIPIQH